MCSRPLKILSRKADKLPVFDKLSYTVPCGHCEECKRNKRLSWFVRLYYQWQQSQDDGGFALFLTLTYNNKNLPKYENYSCFSVSDIQKYIKRFRSKLNRLYPDYSWDDKLKYFCSSELGGKTHRPHYHLIFFCHCPFPRWTFRTLLANEWKFGFTKYGSRNYGFVDSVGALNYCAKYVCKDVYEQKYLSNLMTRLSNQGVSSENLKKFKPFVLCSNGLGLYGLFINDYELLKRGSILMPDSQFSTKSYKLPLYYERKLFYDVKYRVYDFARKDYLYFNRRSDIPDSADFTPVYVLNNEGLGMKKVRFESFLNACRDVYRLSLYIIDMDITKINVKYDTQFKSIDEVKDFCFSLDEETFVNFVSVYRGCSCPSGEFSSLQLSSSLLEDFETSLEANYGLVYDKPALQSFINNLRYYLTIPDIDLKVNIILFIYSLARESLSVKIKQQELDYVDRKSVYLLENEDV